MPTHEFEVTACSNESAQEVVYAIYDSFGFNFDDLDPNHFRPFFTRLDNPKNDFQRVLLPKETKEIPTLGLTREEADALKHILLPLSTNLPRAFGSEKIARMLPDPFDPTEEIDEIDLAFELAKIHCPTDYWARYGIIFDDQTEKGKVYFSHPIVPGITPNLDINQARERRASEVEIRGKVGGIDRINFGHVHEELVQAGLEHSFVQSSNYFIDNEPSLGRRRELWVEFWREKSVEEKTT